MFSFKVLFTVCSSCRNPSSQLSLQISCVSLVSWAPFYFLCLLLGCLSTNFTDCITLQISNKLKLHRMLSIIYPKFIVQEKSEVLFISWRHPVYTFSNEEKKELLGKNNAGCQWMAGICGALGLVLTRDHCKGSCYPQFGVAGMTLHSSVQDSLGFTY